MRETLEKYSTFIAIFNCREMGDNILAEQKIEDRDSKLPRDLKHLVVARRVHFTKKVVEWQDKLVHSTREGFPKPDYKKRIRDSAEFKQCAWE